MAIYHCSIKNITRGKGQSAIASASYRSGEKLKDLETGIDHDYTKKSGVVYSEIMLCKNAPKEFQNREILWNEVQKIEKNSNSRLAREIEVALPREMTRENQIKVVQEYVKNFVDEGMCADFSIHDKGDGNPHTHIMLTTRPIKENGEWGQKEKKAYKLDQNGQKIPQIDPKTGKQKIGAKGRKMWERETVEVNDWNKKENVEKWRKNWADVVNKHIAMGFTMDDIEIGNMPYYHYIDHRSFERRGIAKKPTIHEGYVARKIEKEGGISDRCEINREIKGLEKLENQLRGLKEKVKKKGEQINERFDRFRENRVSNGLSRAKGTREQRIDEISRGLAERERKIAEVFSEFSKFRKKYRDIREKNGKLRDELKESFEQQRVFREYLQKTDERLREREQEFEKAEREIDRTEQSINRANENERIEKDYERIIYYNGEFGYGFYASQLEGGEFLGKKEDLHQLMEEYPNADFEDPYEHVPEISGYDYEW